MLHEERVFLLQGWFVLDYQDEQKQCVSYSIPIYYNMKKASYLPSCLLLSQLEARLIKNPFLSRGPLPSWEDAKVFLAIEPTKKIPSRQTHSCLYHWYVLMSQFARRTLEAWVEAAEENDEDDQLIQEFVWEVNSWLFCKQEEKMKEMAAQVQPRKVFGENSDNWRNVVTSPNNTKRRMSQNYVEFNQNTNLSQKQIIRTPHNSSPPCPSKRVSFNLLAQKHDSQFLAPELEYVMEIELAAEKSGSLDGLKQRLVSQRVDLLSFDGRDGSNVLIVFRSQAEACEGLKDRISQWPEVSNIRFRREKKTVVAPQVKSERTLHSPLRKIANIG